MLPNLKQDPYNHYQRNHFYSLPRCLFTNLIHIEIQVMEKIRTNNKTRRRKTLEQLEKKVAKEWIRES